VHGISTFAFDTLGNRRLEIRCDSCNLPSARVAERAGFRLEGELRNSGLDTSGNLRNTLVYTKIPEEHKAARGRNAS
jgi:RimJ/RimL family protein N-acetyltransferase